MLEIRQNCELCGKVLPANSEEAMICSFECTFCNACVRNYLMNVCQNCGGGFEKRPVRPKESLLKFPAKSSFFTKELNHDSFSDLLVRYQNIKPEDR